MFSNEKNRALIAAFAASLSYAFVPVLLRVSEGYVSVDSVIFNRSWIGVCFLVIFKIIYNSYQKETAFIPTNTQFHDDKLRNEAHDNIEQNPLRSTSLLLTLLWVALSFFGTLMLWAESITQTIVASSEILHSLAAPITTLTSWFLFSQAFGKQFLLGVVLSTLGTIAIFAGDMSSGSNFKGDELALLSALLYAVYLIGVEKIRVYWDSIETVMWVLSSVALLSIPVVLMTSDAIFPSSWDGWLSLVLSSLVGTVTLLLISYSLKSLSSALIATILLMSPCLTALLGWLFFSESLGWLNICGFVVVVIGIYFSVSDKNDKIITNPEQKNTLEVTKTTLVSGEIA